MKSIFVVLLLGVVGAGCLRRDVDGPPVDTSPATNGEAIYEVCREAPTGARIYSWRFCGIDSCEARFYDQDGVLLEHVPHGDGTGGPYAHKPRTQVKDCVRTTEAFVRERIKDTTTLPMSHGL